MNHKNILILGGTGFVGRRIIENLRNKEETIICMTRKKSHHSNGVVFKHWDTHDKAVLASQIEEAKIIINLCGEPIIGKPWTPFQRKKLSHSRINITKQIASVINQAHEVPELWINASAVGIYPSRSKEDFKQPFDEDSKKADTFIGKLCQDWEKYTVLSQSRTRVVNTRLGVVLGREGGAYKKLYPLFNLALGHGLGSGDQAFPWIHINDVVNVFSHIIQNKDLKGPLNVVAPKACTVREFCLCFAKLLRRPFWGMLPSFLPELLLGDMMKLVTEGQFVVSKKLSPDLFEFKQIEGALKNLILKN